MTSWITTRTILTICCQNDSAKSRNRMHNYHRHTARNLKPAVEFSPARVVGNSYLNGITEGLRVILKAGYDLSRLDSRQVATKLSQPN